MSLQSEDKEIHFQNYNYVLYRTCHTTCTLLYQCVYSIHTLCYILLVLREFKEILRKQATVEAFTEWLDSVVENKVIKVRLSILNYQK